MKKARDTVGPWQPTVSTGMSAGAERGNKRQIRIAQESYTIAGEKEMESWGQQLMLWSYASKTRPNERPWETKAAAGNR